MKIGAFSLVIIMQIFACMTAHGSELRTEDAEFTVPAGTHYVVSTTYRGDKQIMVEITIDGRRKERSLHYDDEIRYIEIDENGDGFYETILIPGERAWDYEKFLRHRDGTIEPIPTTRLKREKEEMIYMLKKHEVDDAEENAEGAAE